MTKQIIQEKINEVKEQIKKMENRYRLIGKENKMISSRGLEQLYGHVEFLERTINE